MTDDALGLDYRIHTLRLKPSDVVVFTCDEWLTHAQQTEVRQKLRCEMDKLGINNPVFILSAGADLHALTRADIEAMPV